MQKSEVLNKVLERIKNAENTGSNEHEVIIDSLLKLRFDRQNKSVKCIVKLVLCETFSEDDYINIERALQDKRKLERENALSLL